MLIKIFLCNIHTTLNGVILLSKAFPEIIALCKALLNKDSGNDGGVIIVVNVLLMQTYCLK